MVKRDGAVEPEEIQHCYTLYLFATRNYFFTSPMVTVAGNVSSIHSQCK